MTSGLIVSRRNKLRLHKIYIKNQSPENLLNFKTYRNMYNRLIRLSKRLFYDEKILKCKNTKMVWDVFNEIISKKKTMGIQTN
jgi:hypothetical protein